MSTAPAPKVLGYLLKHVHLRFAALADRALEPYGIDGKDFGTLRVLAGREPTSQLQVAQALGIDRTTMVALLDALERKGIVSRRPDPSDRRKNVVELTESGREAFDAAVVAYARAENDFLAGVDGEQLRKTLQTLLES